MSHEDTIPDHVHLLKSVLAWGGIDDLIGHNLHERADAALDALLADKEAMSRICDKWEREYTTLKDENQRLQEELTTSYLRREADGLIAENQRLREALQRIASGRVVSGDSPDAANLLDYTGIAREALAGDEE